jgi:hypothetical protein
MSIKRKIWKIILTIQSLPQRVIRYISGAVARIFSPSDDNYPSTGVQPYEGELSSKKSF